MRRDYSFGTVFSRRKSGDSMKLPRAGGWPAPQSVTWTMLRQVLLPCYWPKAENARGLGTASPGYGIGL
jgi:hypothetical protein